jgi:hypothetical protein
MEKSRERERGGGIVGRRLGRDEEGAGEQQKKKGKRRAVLSR